MKRVLAVITILCLAVGASSCGGAQVVPVMGATWASGTVGGIVANPNEVKASLPSLTIMTTPTVEELLNAALEVEQIDNTTKSRISIILDFLPELDGWLAEIPGETLLAIDEIMGNVTELETVSNATDFLQEAIASGDYDAYEWLPEALGFGIDLLKDGNLTIYNPAWPPYELSPFEGFNVSQMWKEGLQGGIEGAVGCALAGIASSDWGVKIGGVVGTVDSSIADIISQLSGWW